MCLYNHSIVAQHALNVDTKRMLQFYCWCTLKCVIAILKTFILESTKLQRKQTWKIMILDLDLSCQKKIENKGTCGHWGLGVLRSRTNHQGDLWIMINQCPSPKTSKWISDFAHLCLKFLCAWVKSSSFNYFFVFFILSKV